MMVVEQYLLKLKTEKRRWRKMVAFLAVLSICVAIAVSWNLRLTGITIANSATCGIVEHTHTEECETEDKLICTDASVGHIHSESCYEKLYLCGYEEHLHILSCYSDSTADIETITQWKESLPELTGNKNKDIVLIAQSQLGMGESENNFEVSEDGETKNGITRYGQWYGNPYGPWANMFTSFCLRFAGATEVPINSGAEVMRLEWEKVGLYRLKGIYTPIPGDIVFLDKNQNGVVETTAIVTNINETTVTVIEGDLENKVAETIYAISENIVVGYGISSPESTLMLLSNAVASDQYIAKTIDYNQSMFTEINSFVVYTQSGSNYYAFDGNGNAVQIFIDSNGNITSDVSDSNILLWSFTSSGGTNSYLIQNLSTGRYMHAYPNNGSGVTTSGAYTSTLITATNGVKIRSNSEYAALNTSTGKFVMTQSQSSAASYQFGVTSKSTVWIDGTNGALMALMGSDDKSFTVETGGTVKLPMEWKSPEKYSYVIRGWYDIKNSKYYAPGAELTVNENLVFYADWVASTYDVGFYNSQVADSLSTNDFIEGHVFDYGVLFNVMSVKPQVTVTASGHSETWTQVTSGNVPYQNGQTIDFDFIDYDSTGDISYASNRGDNNINGSIYSNLYSEKLRNILFALNNSFDPTTGEGVIGKQYVGKTDHLFQRNNNPEDKWYGFYYYDSKLNAASYNQTDERFYLYEYLERTSDSEKDKGGGEYSDFLPYNSPYANTNNKTVNTFTYDGENGEYVGTTHYQYDAKYNTNNNSTSNVGTNYGFGMSLDIDFYLPNDPGYIDMYGDSGNRDIYGSEMHFYFSGDDDVWILLDGELVLDIGGVHGIESGDINFSTGVITINDEAVSTLEGYEAGAHVLSFYYLERGSSQSNCSIYFNLAPRFSLTIQKEDVLSRDLLNGAEFSVFLDKDCTIPANLWETMEAYRNGDEPTNIFSVENGKATMWGFSSSSVYYLKESKAPDLEHYTKAHGIICLNLNKNGEAEYSVEIQQDQDENGNPVEITQGFTVHGFRIDEETQEAFMIVTNAPAWVTETTSVYVQKAWDDNVGHSEDSVTIYLNITEADGTVIRIREQILNANNNWEYTWTNIPKYAEDGVTEIKYSVSEAYFSGYSDKVEILESGTFTEIVWNQVSSFTNGETYILKTSDGCLSAVSATEATLCFVDEETAKQSPLALWTATVSGSNVKLTNQNGQILTFRNNYSSRYYYLTTSSANYQSLATSSSSSGIAFYYRSGWSSYYLSGLNTSSYGSAVTSSSSALYFTPLEKSETTVTYEYEDDAFRVTNTPLEVEASFEVTKHWEHPTGDTSIYEQEQVTIKLFANGIDTGRTVTLNLKNNWTDIFEGLPYTDNNGNIINYTVEESWETVEWIPVYGSVSVVEGDITNYKTTITNTYRQMEQSPLPSTGGRGQIIYMLCGFVLMLIPLVYGFRLRRTYERRQK